jgi:2-keto-3-deoxy-L-rhamnonate aldolase RhmA
MELPQNGFKRLLARGAPVPVGSWLMSASPIVTEAMGLAGFDWLVVDMEHVPIDTPQLLAQLQVLAGTPAAPVVRVPWNDQVMVKRALDAGAQTVMFPFVQSADEARRAVAHTRYPPAGVRGVAGTHRGSRYGLVGGYLQRAGDEIAVIVQLETPAAMAALEDIAGVDGVDALFIGPGDLSAAMGHLGAIGHADVQRALKDGVQRCRRAGKPVGIVGGTPALVQQYIADGFDYVAIASDMTMLLGCAQSYLGELRAGAVAARDGSAY